MPVVTSDLSAQELKELEEFNAKELARQEAELNANPELKRVVEQAIRENEEEQIRSGAFIRDPVTGQMVAKPASTKDAIVKGLKIGGIGVAVAAAVTWAVKKWG